MRFEPHDYQTYALQRVLDQPAVGLLLEMGLGKTVVALTAVDELMYNRFEVSRVLVIAPLKVADATWATEAAKWDHTRHLRISKVLGSAAERIAALERPADVYVINRENVEWLVEYLGKAWPFDMVIIDELSSFKSPKAHRFRALRKVRPRIRRIVGLTGTPAPNGLIDLWSQIYLLDRGERLGKTLTDYRDKYFDEGRRNRDVIFEWVPKPFAEEAIYEQLADLCVSMKAADWLQLPERLNNVIPVRLPPTAREKYRRLEKDLLLMVDDTAITADAAGALSNKLLQLANGAVYDEGGQAVEVHDAKLTALDDLIEAANGQPVLVFYWFRHDLTRLKTHLPAARTLDTAADVEAWNAGRIPILLAHPASAGHGLNLQTGGHIVVWFGLTWSLELYQQANARLDRQGQQHGVIVHHLVTEGTVDEDVMAALGAKAVGQDALMNAVKARIERVRGEG